jgi:hypothetical protein
VRNLRNWKPLGHAAPDVVHSPWLEETAPIPER